VPIHAFEENLTNILPFLGTHTVLVDIATVKVYTVGILKRVAGEKQWIATHPMWGPESYKKKNSDVSGFRIVMSDGTLPCSYAYF
jgi:prephenate dehydrogenase